MKLGKKRAISAVLTVGMAAGLMAGCGGTYTNNETSANNAGTTAAEGGSEASGSDGAATVDTFSFVSQEPVTLDLRASNSNLDAYVFYLTNAMLYRSIDGEVVPELCDTMEVSEDGKVYTYTIKDAVYTDGTAITASDFEYGFEQYYITSENYNSIVGGEDFYLNGAEDCEGVYTVDEKTFVVELENPTTAFDGLLEVYPLNKEYVDGQGNGYGGTPDTLQYSGPYVLTEWVVGSSMSFVKNDSYINAETSFPTKNVKMTVSTDESTTYSLYQNGDVDAIVSVNSTLAEMLGEDNINWYTSGNLIGLEFNTTGFTYKEGDGFVGRGDEVTALMQNMNFRKALAYAINREALVAAVDTASVVTDRFVNSSASGTGDGKYVEQYSLENTVPLTGDTDAAKEYLAEALKELGYSDVSELPELTYLTFETAKQKTIAEALVSVWKSELGLENIVINLQPIQSAIMSMVFMDYDIYLQQLSLSVDDELSMLSYWMTQGGVSDAAGFQAGGAPSFIASMHANEEYDALINDAYTDFDEESHYAKVLEAEQMLYDDLVYFPLMEGGTYYAVQDYVEGYNDTSVDYGYSYANLIVYEH